MRHWKTLASLALVLTLGCQKFDLRSQSPDTPVEDFETKVETPLIGEFTTTAGLNLITLQGVGLVVGLDGTGGDPPVSVYRTTLLNDMRRRGIPNPNQILADPSTAMVVVRAYLPPLVRKGDTFDLKVWLPPNSNATSLRGGHLLETHLAEHALVPGQGYMKGHIFAKAEGPILVSHSVDDEGKNAALVRRGAILAGGRSLKERDLSMFLKSGFRSIRNSKRIADRIALRFFDYNESGIRRPLAEAKTDQKIELKLHPTYRENYPRYLQVIRNIAFRETEVAQRVRMQHLATDLLNPIRAERAALQLEAIGQSAIPMLKDGLKSPLLECRLHAGVALAYLGDDSGVPALEEAARAEPAFRIYAMAALAAVDTGETHMALRRLMSESSPETRYGAFRALTVLDQYDPFIRGDNMNDQFTLHVVDTEGDPMVHVTRRRKAEIVLFGRDQELRTPVVLRAGKDIIVRSTTGSDRIVVSRFEIGKPDQRREVSRRLEDVIRVVAEFGGSYPDVVELLMDADSQHNLPGVLGIDELPQAGRVYYRPVPNQETGVSKSTRVGIDKLMPNLFDSVKEDAEDEQAPATDEFGDGGTASAVDVRDASDEGADVEPRFADDSKKSSLTKSISSFFDRFRRSGN